MGKVKQALIKDASDLQDCKKGTEVILVFKNGEDFTGIFEDLDGDDTIIIKSLTSENRIGLPFNKLEYYLERIK